MVWGSSFELDRDMGPAARILIDEHDRRCAIFGSESREVRSFVATELGFEHNLGLLHKAYYARASGIVRHGVVEHEYYLERCLLEAVGASILQRGMLMCASVVGDAMVGQMYARVFSRELVLELPEPVGIPELRIHPASTVGAEETDVVISDSSDDLRGGFCYLALIRPEYVGEARRVLGSEPTLLALVNYGTAGRFLSDVDLAQHCISQAGSGYHVGGRGGKSFSLVLREILSDPDANGWLVNGDDLYLPTAGVGADAGVVLCAWLSDVIGQPVTLSQASLALVTKSAALLDPDGKKRLRSLEAVGDSVLTIMIARDNYFRGESVERFQNLRSRVTSNKVLSEKFIQNVPPDAVQFVGGVDPAAGVTGAKAFESIFGAVWLELGDDAVVEMLVKLKFLDFPLQVRNM